MADLFEDSGSDGDIADTFNSSPVTATNGYGYGEKDEPSPTWNGESEVKRKDVPSGHGGEEEEEEVSKGPRDEIRLTVVEFQRTADDFTYDIMVGLLASWVGLPLALAMGYSLSTVESAVQCYVVTSTPFHVIFMYLVGCHDYRWK